MILAKIDWAATGAIAGIVAAVLSFIAAVFASLTYYHDRHRRRAAKAERKAEREAAEKHEVWLVTATLNPYLAPCSDRTKSEIWIANYGGADAWIESMELIVDGRPVDLPPLVEPLLSSRNQGVARLQVPLLPDRHATVTLRWRDGRPGRHVESFEMPPMGYREPTNPATERDLS